MTPDTKTMPYGTWRWLFAALLVIAVLLLIVTLRPYFTWIGRQPSAAEVTALSDNAALILSIITALVSLIGLLSTNWLAWRREARDARLAELQLEQQRLEIEKLRLELEKSKAVSGKE